MISIEHNNSTYNFSVFDAHNHIGLDKEGNVKDTSYKQLKDVLGDVDKTILFSSNSPAAGPFFIISNMEVLDTAKKSKGKVIPFYRFDLFEANGCKYRQTGMCNSTHECIVNKYLDIDCGSNFDLERFFIEIKNLGFAGLKLHPRASEINYIMPQLDNDLMRKVVNAAGKVGLVVSIHTHNKNMVSQFFNLAEKMLPKYDNLVLICAHSGGGSTKLKRRESREYAGKQLNRYINSGEKWVKRMLFDTSNVFWKYLLNGLLLCEDLQKTDKSSENIRNIVYGTDWPFVKEITPQQKAIDTINSLFSGGFTAEEIELIMSGNLENLIKDEIVGKAYISRHFNL